MQKEELTQMLIASIASANCCMPTVYACGLPTLQIGLHQNACTAEALCIIHPWPHTLRLSRPVSVARSHVSFFCTVKDHATVLQT
jgi:hypothetical protein